MNYLIIQVILLVLVAFVIGVLIGCWAKKLFASPKPSEPALVETETKRSTTQRDGVAFSSKPESTIPERKPATLSAPRGGSADDLKRIKGIGKVNEGRLNDLGIYHFEQIAKWNENEIAWIDDHLSFRGRIEREDWVAQARILAEDE